MKAKKEKTKKSKKNKDKNKSTPPKTFEEALQRLNYATLFSGEWIAQIISTIHPANADKLETDGRASIFKIDNFLSDAECNYIISNSKKTLQPARTTGATPDYRTSRTTVVAPTESSPEQLLWRLLDLDVRVSNCINLHPSLGEPFEFEYFQSGEYFKKHTDYFSPYNLQEYGEHVIGKGQRTMTFTIFLNTPEVGGETFFTTLNKKIKPKKGMALIWNNLNEDGSPNELTLHEELPVLKGYKSMITKWFRDRGQ